MTVASNGVTPKIGQKVLVTAKDGSQYMAEIFTLHSKVKNLITKVRVAKQDGSYTIQEVSELVVEAVILVKDITISELAKAFVQYLKNIFK